VRCHLGKEAVVTEDVPADEPREEPIVT
jgi:hypothetical protein